MTTNRTLQDVLQDAATAVTENAHIEANCNTDCKELQQEIYQQAADDADVLRKLARNIGLIAIFRVVLAICAILSIIGLGIGIFLIKFLG